MLNPEWGETVKAFVVVDGEMGDVEKECRDFLKDKMAAYKIPKLYEKMEALPRNVTSKPMKNQLREESVR